MATKPHRALVFDPDQAGVVKHYVVQTGNYQLDQAATPSQRARLEELFLAYEIMDYGGILKDSDW